MPPVVIQPGLGESLNRYLERLGRRGEEQRALQAERNNIQASIDARAAETRTRMISQSINQSVGLFTDELQRDRASQRRIGEAEEVQQLRGRPARQDMYSDLGIVTTHNSQFSFLMRETGLAGALMRARDHVRTHPNELRPKQVTDLGALEAQVKGFEEYISNGRNVDQGPFVEGMTGIIQAILDITPAGKKKPTHLDNVYVNDGSDPSNPLPKNWPMQMGKDEMLHPIDHPLMKIFEKMIEQESFKQIENPEFKKYQALSEEEQEGIEEPNPFMDTGVEAAVAMIDMNLVNELSQAMWGNANPADVARTLLGGAALEAGGTAVRGATAEPSGEQSPFSGEMGKLARSAKGREAQAVDAIRKGGATPFDGLEQAPLDRLLKQGVELIWPDPIEHQGKMYHVRYVGGGNTELIEVAEKAETPRARPPRRPPFRGLVPPGVMKQ